jgi:hypothetical protein
MRLAGGVQPPYRARRVDAGDGAMALVDTQRLGKLVAYPGVQRRGAARGEAG